LGQRGDTLGRVGRLARGRKERKVGGLAWLGLRKRERGDGPARPKGDKGEG
jgi:hypothetical protein